MQLTWPRSLTKSSLVWNFKITLMGCELNGLWGSFLHPPPFPPPPHPQYMKWTTLNWSDWGIKVWRAWFKFLPQFESFPFSSFKDLKWPFTGLELWRLALSNSNIVSITKLLSELWFCGVVLVDDDLRCRDWKWPNQLQWFILDLGSTLVRALFGIWFC